jgi:hypothetical protein
MHSATLHSILFPIYPSNQSSFFINQEKRHSSSLSRQLPSV